MIHCQINPQEGKQQTFYRASDSHFLAEKTSLTFKYRWLLRRHRIQNAASESFKTWSHQ